MNMWLWGTRQHHRLFFGVLFEDRVTGFSLEKANGCIYNQLYNTGI